MKYYFRLNIMAPNSISKLSGAAISFNVFPENDI